MTSGSDMGSLLSAALAGAHDFDAVAGFERGLAPRRARHDRPVERYRDAALRGIDRLFLKQSGQGRGAQDLVLAVDPNVRGTGHRVESYSAARAGAKRPIPNGRIAGSTVPSSTSRAIASAVT